MLPAERLPRFARCYERCTTVGYYGEDGHSGARAARRKRAPHSLTCAANSGGPRTSNSTPMLPSAWVGRSREVDVMVKPAAVLVERLDRAPLADHLPHPCGWRVDEGLDHVRSRGPLAAWTTATAPSAGSRRGRKRAPVAVGPVSRSRRKLRQSWRSRS